MNYQKSKKLNLSKKTCAVTTNAVILICLGILTVFCAAAVGLARERPSEALSQPSTLLGDLTGWRWASCLKTLQLPIRRYHP